MLRCRDQQTGARKPAPSQEFPPAASTRTSQPSQQPSGQAAHVPGQDEAAVRRGVEVVGVRGTGAVGDRRGQVALFVAEAKAEYGLFGAAAAGAEHGVAGRVRPRQHPERLEEAGAGAALPDHVQAGVQFHDESAATVDQERSQIILRSAAVADCDDGAVGVQGDALDGAAPGGRVGAERRHRAGGGKPQQHAILLHGAGPGIPVIFGSLLCKIRL